MNKKIIIFIVLFIFGTFEIASAGSVIILPIDTKSVLVGDIVEYTFILNTTNVGAGTLSWRTNDPSVIATIDGASFTDSGEISINTVKNTPQLHILKVKPEDGVIIGSEYSIYIEYCIIAQDFVPKHIINITATADTDAYLVFPNTIIGSEPIVGMWHSSAGDFWGFRDVSIGYTRFDNISEIKAPINSATMWLYTGISGTQTINFYTPNVSWDEYTLTWNNKPSSTNFYTSVYHDGSTAHWINVDVTDVVQKWNKKIIPNDGLMSFASTSSVFWNSRENPENKPYISINTQDYIVEKGAVVKARVEATVIPTPELSTIVYIILGLIGIISVVKFDKIKK